MPIIENRLRRPEEMKIIGKKLHVLNMRYNGERAQKPEETTSVLFGEEKNGGQLRLKFEGKPEIINYGCYDLEAEVKGSVYQSAMYLSVVPGQFTMTVVK
jgi:hypothetical protein